MNKIFLLHIHKYIGLICTCALALIMTGCAGVPERHPLPLELTNQARIHGIPNARFRGDEWPKFSVAVFEKYMDEDFRKNLILHKRNYAQGTENFRHPADKKRRLRAVTCTVPGGASSRHMRPSVSRGPVSVLHPLRQAGSDRPPRAVCRWWT